MSPFSNDFSEAVRPIISILHNIASLGVGGGGRIMVFFCFYILSIIHNHFTDIVMFVILTMLWNLLISIPGNAN